MPRPPKNRPPRRCKNWMTCGNDLVGKQIKWCTPCGKAEQTRQKKGSNATAYAALREPGRVLLDAEAAHSLRECFDLLSGAWNAYNTGSEDDEPAARDVLLDALEGVLDRLWADLPTSFRPRA